MSNQVASYIHIREDLEVTINSVYHDYATIKIESDDPGIQIIFFVRDLKDIINFKNSVLQAFEKELRYV